MQTKEMIATHPDVRGNVNQALIDAIDLDACMTPCRVCGEECQRHASTHEHCRVYAESCRGCETACQGALRGM
jgi:hypothetical protein